ncbi:MAG: helix-turn-helix transcriptional regulator [Phycisphaerae bacterium]|nr:helix-turn-helix transcriptional regulator [Phycisphaerae bacterium]
MDNVIRKTFRESGLTVAELAGRAGVAYSITHRFISGHGNVGLRNADKFCRVLGLELTRKAR